jgi:Tol biopolymer transport system component
MEGAMRRVVTTAALVLVVVLAAAGCWSRSVDDGAPAASSGGKASPTRQREVAPATGLTGRVVYSSVQGDLWVMQADGSHRRQLTHSGAGIDSSPTRSPDGKRIAFRTTQGQSPPGMDPSNIFIINADGSGERQLTPRRGAVAGGLFPAWSPDGSWIAYSNGSGINLIRPDGSGRRQLGVPGECSVWSPDGSELMFCSNGVNRGEGVDNWDVFVMDADGTHVRRLTRNLAQDYPGAWSPDGTQLAFFSRRDGDGDVYVMDADGSNVRRVTNQAGAQAVDAWLPDGRLVIGSAQEGVEGPPDWFVMGLDRSGRASLPQLKTAMEPIAWLP